MCVYVYVERYLYIDIIPDNTGRHSYQRPLDDRLLLFKMDMLPCHSTYMLTPVGMSPQHTVSFPGISSRINGPLGGNRTPIVSLGRSCSIH